VTLTISSWSGGNASGSYDLHFTDDTYDSATFTASICHGAVVCGG
jgi:putative intracellular protease/amidase